MLLYRILIVDVESSKLVYAVVLFVFMNARFGRKTLSLYACLQ